MVQFVASSSPLSRLDPSTGALARAARNWLPLRCASTISNSSSSDHRMRCAISSNGETVSSCRQYSGQRPQNRKLKPAASAPRAAAVCDSEGMRDTIGCVQCNGKRSPREFARQPFRPTRDHSKILYNNKIREFSILVHMSSASQRVRRFLLGVFIVSGFTGLIYESIWSHYLQLYLGHAAYAQTLVLGIYMGGMACGSWWIGRRSRAIRGLLRGYVLVEGLIGLLGLVFHGLFVRAVDWSFASVIPAMSAPWQLDAFKWSLGALLILPQSVLLGMTFPMISGGLIRRWPERPGETLALLYFSNSLGAAIGVLVSGFALIDAVGLPGTIRTAGALNLALALAVWLAIRSRAEPPAPAGESAAEPAPAVAPLA